MKFSKEEKINILLIIISAISIITSFILSVEYISWIAIILCGIPIFKECIEELTSEMNIKADLLVTIAIIASIIIGEIFAAGEIATIMAIGGFLEEYTVSKTQEKLETLIKMTPQTATRIKNGTEEKIPVEKVKINDTLKVLPGESIPTDGIIIKGETSIDQSALTGESMPVDKKENDNLYSGTINLYGSFIMKATKISHDSSLQKLIRLVESSSPENAKIVRTADRWATWIVIIAFLSSVATYFITQDIIRSVTILVVFCPCALVLATPTAIMAAIGNLTKFKILVKDGKSLEELAQINELIFDKTGTLTYGNPEIIRIDSDDKKELLYLLTSIESKSEHPIAKAIMKHKYKLAEVTDFKMHVGKGVTGYINNSKIIAGNEKLLESENINIKNTKEAKNGEIKIYVVKNSEMIGTVYLADKLRETSKITIKRLKRLGIKTTLLTGDNEKTGKYISKQVKVSDAKFNCLPEDKTNYIKDVQLKGNTVAMIGDGVNDAPSLKKANVGIAMGEIGSDVSIEAANIALINDNIEDIPHLIAISRKTLKTININIAFSLTLNIIAMILAVFGILGPITGALIHNIGSVIVIIFSSTLVNYKLTKKDYRRNYNASKYNKSATRF